MTFDLAGYFKRINYHGSGGATLDTLLQLHLAHTCAIPFENLDVLLGRTVHLEEAAIFEKLVTAGRGGYCFEQNSLFRRVLETLGFTVTNLSARVLLTNPPCMPPRTHRLTKVMLDGEAWIADVGFGGKTLPAPVRLLAGQLQTTTHGIYSLEKCEHDWLLKFHGDEKIIDLYRFNLEEQYFSDYQMGNHYVSTWPESHFRHHLMMSRYLSDGGKQTWNSAGENAAQFTDTEALYWHLQRRFNLRFDHPRHGITLAEFSLMINRIMR